MRRLYQPAVLSFALCAGLFLALGVAGQNSPVRIVSISPTSGPEGTRVKIAGENLQQAAAVFFGQSRSDFKVISPDALIVIVPHRAVTSPITVVTPKGRSKSPFSFTVVNDPRVPDEVSYKSGYVNSVGRPDGFRSARMWGIAIADTRVAGYESARVEIASTQLSCRFDGREVLLNNDAGNVHGGLFVRRPWFGGHNYHEWISLAYDLSKHVVMLNVGQRTDRVWHFWSPSPRTVLPEGEVEGCTARARVRISQGALVQIGFDYWRSPTVGYDAGGNNHEAGASNWYFPSDQWQEATFTDIGGLQF